MFNFAPSYHCNQYKMMINLRKISPIPNSHPSAKLGMTIIEMRSFAPLRMTGCSYLSLLLHEKSGVLP